jgi:DNA-binding response OmpR family regulator
MTAMPVVPPRRSVLVVEDSDVLRALMSRVFQREGFDVLSASTGPGGVEAAVTNRPDIVVLDVGLPDMNGLEVCRQLKSNAATAALPIVLVTGRDHVEDRRAGFRAGADAFLVKPVRIDDLVNAVRLLVPGESRAADRIATHGPASYG